jgi:hypothetical protein
MFIFRISGDAAAPLAPPGYATDNRFETLVQTRLNFFCFAHISLPLDFQAVVQKKKMLRISLTITWNQQIIQLVKVRM